MGGACSTNEGHENKVGHYNSEERVKSEGHDKREGHDIDVSHKKIDKSDISSLAKCIEYIYLR